MKEKIKRILDLIRAGKLNLDDAAPLLAALSAKLALTDSDRELVQSLLNREDLDTGQVAEHLMLLRGIRETGSVGYVPSPPRAPMPPRGPRVVIGGKDMGGLDSLGDRIAAKIEAAAAAFAAKAERWGEDVGDTMSNWADEVERNVDRAVDSIPPTSASYRPKGNPRGNRILRIEVRSEDGDNYEANIPVSLAGHLHKLVPPYGVKALEKSGFSLEALQLIIEADPPPGAIIEASDENGNTVEISIK